MYAHGFLCGVAVALLAVTVALLIGEAVLKRKIRDMKKRAVREAVEVVNGRWERAEEFEFISGEYVTTGYHCNKCGCYYRKKSNYCPNCGADMRERKDNG